MSWNPASREDRAIAERSAAAINAYWKARGVEANARVGADGAIVSDLGTGKNGEAVTARGGGAAPSGAEMLQAAILNHLTRLGGHGATLDELAARAKVRRALILEDLDALHRKGLVARRIAGKRVFFVAAGSL